MLSLFQLLIKLKDQFCETLAGTKLLFESRLWRSVLLLQIFSFFSFLNCSYFISNVSLFSSILMFPFQKILTLWLVLFASNYFLSLLRKTHTVITIARIKKIVTETEIPIDKYIVAKQRYSSVKPSKFKQFDFFYLGDCLLSSATTSQTKFRSIFKVF